MKKSIILFLKGLYHLIPLLPLLFLKNITITIVLCLIVIMPYIKVKKISYQHLDAEKKSSPQLDEIRRSLAFWKAFTFLKK